MKNPDAHRGETVTFTGTVESIEIMSASTSWYTIAVDDKYSELTYVSFRLPAGAAPIVEDDSVKVVASYYGMVSYEDDWSDTPYQIPSFAATEITVQDSAGYHLQMSAPVRPSGDGLFHGV